MPVPPQVLVFRDPHYSVVLYLQCDYFNPLDFFAGECELFRF